ncbi:MAG: hypothetical protein DDT18_00974 [Actinobacteria bacterium]|nr:hypothetical protein [Actinomycetota bacterium]
MLTKLVIALLIILLTGCATLPCKRESPPPLQTVYGFMDCGLKKIEYEGKVKEYKVYCITEEDRAALETWIIFWCK